MTNPTPLLTVQEVADRLQLSSSAVYRLVESGRLACHRLGSGRGVIRVSEEDLRRYLDGCRHGARPAERPAPPRPSLRHLKL